MDIEKLTLDVVDYLSRNDFMGAVNYVRNRGLPLGMAMDFVKKVRDEVEP